MSNNILGIYKITYLNNIFQFKNLIEHINYMEDIKVKEDEIYELEKKNKFKPTKESVAIKKYIKDTYGSHWFTNKSPLYYSIFTGVLELPINQGGNHLVKIIKL